MVVDLVFVCEAGLLDLRRISLLCSSAHFPFAFRLGTDWSHSGLETNFCFNAFNKESSTGFQKFPIEI